jgi:CubicO group peptidase (beta-lactamase class C family)
MTIAARPMRVAVKARSAATRGGFRQAAGSMLSLLVTVGLFGMDARHLTRAEEASKSATSMEARIRALIPNLEAYIQSGMKAYDLPGLAIGIVSGDRLIYAKGFGVRSKAGAAPVDTRTVFQIGSVNKGFLATTMAIMVDRGKLHWDDRVLDLHPAFQLKDPWVTREFRAFDMVAQRSGLPPYANDLLRMLGYEEPAVIRSLRHVDPVSSFRTTFAYTNVTHLLAGRIVSDLAGAPDWNAVVQRELLDPLGMAETSYTAEAINAAANHAEGHRWTPGGTVEVPFEPMFPLHSARPATSIPPSRTWPAGSVCNSATAASRGGALCRRKALPTRASPRSRSRTGCPTRWGGSLRARPTAPSCRTKDPRTPSALSSACCLTGMSG